MGGGKDGTGHPMIVSECLHPASGHADLPRKRERCSRLRRLRLRHRLDRRRNVADRIDRPRALHKFLRPRRVEHRADNQEFGFEATVVERHDARAERLVA